MKSSNIKIKIQAVIAAAGTVLLAAGCASSHEEGSTEYTYPTTSTTTTSQGGTGQTYETQTSTASSAPGNIVVPLQKEQMAVSTQQVPQGSVRIKKYVKTETVTQPVTVRSEQVSIERVPEGQGQAQAQGQSGSLGAPFQSGELTINLNKEQPVVSTQVVPAGSVVISKQTVSQTESVSRPVRKEEVAAIPSGNASNVQVSGNVSEQPPQAQGAPPAPVEENAGQGEQTLTQPDQLAQASDPSAMIGKQCNFPTVTIQKVISPRLIAVGTSSSAPIYVRTEQPVSGLNPGDQVTISGTVAQVPPQPQSLGFDEQSAQALQGQKVYIDAKTVTSAPK